MKLKFASYRETDDIFNAVKSGRKTIETRPASSRIRNLKKGDKLILVSKDTGTEIVKQVKDIRVYESLEKMSKKEDFSKIFPGVKNWDELLHLFEEFKQIWGSNYAKSIEKNGIAAIDIE